MKLLKLLSCIFVLSCYSSDVSVMSYNVENLFDTTHDEGKNDYTYLPYALKKKSSKIQKYCKSIRNASWRNQCLYTDWTPEGLELKLEGLAKVIKSYDKGGADIIFLQEVENLNVLKMLQKALKDSSYKYVSLVEGKDNRGIDNGVISRFPIISTDSHLVDISQFSKRATRDIFEATIQLNKKTKVTFFANHWPSQGAPGKFRVKAAKALIEAASATKKHLTIALGDFNTLKTDSPHGINLYVLKEFTDAHLEAKKQGSDLLKGSHWWGGHWSRLDRVFVRESNLKTNTAHVDYRSFNIYSREFMLGSRDWTDNESGETTTYDEVPLRFNNKTFEGYSDHLPLVFNIVY